MGDYCNRDNSYQTFMEFYLRSELLQRLQLEVGYSLEWNLRMTKSNNNKVIKNRLNLHKNDSICHDTLNIVISAAVIEL